MRKLDKTKILSTTYKRWEENLEISKQSHPNYSSENEYFIDIFTNLLNIQKGLCAYTEKFICNSGKISDGKWINGRFKNQEINIKPFCKGGNLDHFNPDLKNNKAFLWDNLFFIDTDANQFKRNKPVNEILKPDLPDYDEFKLLEYDAECHFFIANTDLDLEKQAQVNTMILGLGINLVYEERKCYLSERIDDVILGKKAWESITVYQFPTAFEMLKRQKQKS